jgi:biotin carboxylase
VRKFAENHSFPLILKPANLVKSLLVTKSDTLDELLANFARTSQTIEATYQQHAPSRQPRILIEEFLDGSLHSVAAFADQNGSPHILQQVVDLIPARERGFDDNFLYQRTLPSRLSEDEQSAMYECAAEGMRALKMKSTPAHIEIILTAKGPRIVEIGARNGGYRERMYDIASGIDIVQAAIDAATGKNPNLTPARNEPCAVIEIFPVGSGTFSSITEAKKIASLPSCVYFASKVKPGEQVGPAADGYKRCAIIVLHNTDQQQFAKDLQFVQQQAHAQLQ